MNLFIYLIIILNFIWSIYITVLLYKKNSQLKNKQNSNPDNQLKIKVTRFNPFNDTGGEQSFILSILDKNNSGVILTSLHNRDITRVYSKPIKLFKVKKLNEF